MTPRVPLASAIPGSSSRARSRARTAASSSPCWRCAWPRNTLTAAASPWRARSRESGLRPGGVSAAHERPVAELQRGVGLALGVVPQQVRGLRIGPRVEPGHGQHPPEVGVAGPGRPGPLEALRRPLELPGVVAGHAQEVLDLREVRVQPGRRLEPLRGALEAPALRLDDAQVDVGAGQGLGHAAPQGLARCSGDRPATGEGTSAGSTAGRGSSDTGASTGPAPKSPRERSATTADRRCASARWTAAPSASPALRRASPSW